MVIFGRLVARTPAASVICGTGVPRSVAVGRPLMFFSNIAVMGKSVAVKEVAHFDVTRSSTMAGQVADYNKSKPERDLQRRVASADLIVTGTVDSIGTRAAAREGPEGSEHDPEWTQATVTVQSTEKGAAQQRVTVWFAASDDIRWFRSPKLKAGQSAVFLLHRPRERERDQPTGYTVVDQLDVQPAPQRDRVRQLINRPR